MTLLPVGMKSMLVSWALCVVATTSVSFINLTWLVYRNYV